MQLIFLIIAAALAYSWWTGEDSNNVPRQLTGMTAHVYDEDRLIEHYAGLSKGHYWKREHARLGCRRKAFDFAEAHRLRNWSYMCCTMTEASTCATRVR